MAYSDKRIIEAMESGDIIIEPFHKEQLNTSSYDLRLGKFFYREQQNTHRHNVYNIYQEDHTKRVWGISQQAQPAKEVFEKYEFEWSRGISPDDLIIYLQPGETILAHTQEFIGGLNHITTQMQARSSAGRNFIEVCKCAGWGDVGYVNRWTMEITNNSRYYAIPLVVGRRFCQMIFYETGEILANDYTQQDSKYSHATNIEQLKKDWNPEMMLPKMWKDREARRSQEVFEKEN